jgi:hypothetical protein
LLPTFWSPDLALEQVKVGLVPVMGSDVVVVMVLHPALFGAEWAWVRLLARMDLHVIDHDALVD